MYQTCWCKQKALSVADYYWNQASNWKNVGDRLNSERTVFGQLNAFGFIEKYPRVSNMLVDENGKKRMVTPAAMSGHDYSYL